MAKRRRELLKFRDGDVGLKIRKDGQLELAGISEKHGMIDKNGMVNPAMLFASAWARRDPKVFQVLVDNFKESVREGYFGPEVLGLMLLVIGILAPFLKQLSELECLQIKQTLHLPLILLILGECTSL